MTCISRRRPPKRNNTASAVSLLLSLTASLQAAAQAAAPMSMSCAPRSLRPKGTVRELERWPRPALLLSRRVYFVNRSMIYVRTACDRQQKNFSVSGFVLDKPQIVHRIAGHSVCPSPAIEQKHSAESARVLVCVWFPAGGFLSSQWCLHSRHSSCSRIIPGAVITGREQVILLP